MVYILVQILESVRPFTPLVMDFIQYGGVDLLEKAAKVHHKDDYLSLKIPKLSKVILTIGAASSIDEINKEGTQSQLCQCCQEVVERAKHPLGRAAKLVVPHPADRINRVLRFMDNFRPRVDVQIAGLDAVLVFCRNADAVLHAKDTEVFAVISETLKSHIQESAIAWRVAMAFAILSSYTQDYAVNICAAEVHEPLMDMYPTLHAHTIAQQQIIWLCSALLKWPRSTRVLHKSRKCMDFFLTITGDPKAPPPPAPATKKKDTTTKSPDAPGTKKTPGGSGNKKKPVPKTKGNNTSSKRDLSTGSKTPGGKNKKKVYAEDDELDEEKRRAMSIGARVEGSTTPVVIPINIRRFLRETEGLLYKEKSDATKAAAAAKVSKESAQKRRIFDEKPRFGTLETNVFTAGEKGLLTNDDEDELGEKKEAPKEWQSMLNYGEEKSPPPSDQKKKPQR